MGIWRCSDWAVNLEQRAVKRDELSWSLRRNWVITAALHEARSEQRGAFTVQEAEAVYTYNTAVPLEIMWIGFVLYVCTMCVIIHPSIQMGGKMCSERMSGKCLKYECTVFCFVYDCIQLETWKGFVMTGLLSTRIGAQSGISRAFQLALHTSLLLIALQT